MAKQIQEPVSQNQRPADLRVLSIPECAALSQWLPINVTSSAYYRHALIVEDVSKRQSAINIVVEYVRMAHADEVKRLREIVADVHDPRRPSGTIFASALSSYPKSCHPSTLKGFFGEIIAGLLTQLYEPHSEAWKIPAFFFYENDALFQELIRAASLGTKPRNAIGHFGDDCLAFAMTDDGSEISRMLTCEAKCTDDHDASMIQDAHKKLGEQRIEVSIIWLQKLIHTLRSRSDQDAIGWINSLMEFKDSAKFVEHNRDDLVSYTHGRRPKNAQSTWIGRSSPHAGYAATRRLEAFEIHFSGLTALITEIYNLAFK